MWYSVCVCCHCAISITWTFCKPGNVAMAPWRLLKLMPCKLSVVVWATGWVLWFWLLASFGVPVTMFCFRIWNAGAELAMDDESSWGGCCCCCWCVGLESGEAAVVTLFFGDGDIKWADDDPDECGDGPHLFWLLVFCLYPLILNLHLSTIVCICLCFFFYWALIKLNGIEHANTYMDTSRKFLSALGTRSMEPELHSLLMMDVVGDAEPMNGNPGVIEKPPKFDEDVLDAFESLPGDGAANESRRNLLLLLILLIKICCGGWLDACCWACCDFNWAKLKFDGFIGELDIRAGGDANWLANADIVARTFGGCCSGLNKTVCVCAYLQEKYSKRTFSSLEKTMTDILFIFCFLFVLLLLFCSNRNGFSIEFDLIWFDWIDFFLVCLLLFFSF